MPYVGPEQTAAWVIRVGDYDWDPVVMVAIAGAESGWNTDAISPTNDYGLFQINRTVWAFLFDLYNWRDGLENTVMAYYVWRRQGYSAWTVYNTGPYLRFIDIARRAVDSVKGPVQFPPDLSGAWENFKNTATDAMAEAFYAFGDAINLVTRF
jgi:hypothetical protein